MTRYAETFLESGLVMTPFLQPLDGNTAHDIQTLLISQEFHMGLCEVLWTAQMIAFGRIKCTEVGVAGVEEI